MSDDQKTDAIQRRMDTAKSSPEAQLREALELLKSPDIPPEAKAAHAKPLLIVEHFVSKGIPIPDHLKE